MKRYTPFLAASLMLAAFAPLQTRAADNTWNNGSTDFLWNGTSLNWASPTTWVDGDNAIFNATGAGTISLGAAITVHNQTFNSAGYTIAGVGNALTLASTTPTITVNASATNDASISGTDGLTVQGTSFLTLRGDSSLPVPGNNYTGGTYVKSGILILSVGTNGTGPSQLPNTSYAVDSIEAIDPGAIVREGNINNGLDISTSDQKIQNGQIPISGTGSGLAEPHRLNLTGGTYDTFGNDNNQQQPQPSGFGTIINTSPYARGILKFTGYGQTTEFSGQIMDGGAPIARTNNGPGYQMSVDSQSGSSSSVLILSGSNSFTGFIRIGNNATIQLKGGGTMGYPVDSSPLRQVIQNNGVMDLNGTSQRTGYYYTGNSGSARITNTAIGTLSILTVGVNSTNLATFTNSSVSKGIQTDIQDDPATSGLIGLTKEGACVQPIGLSGGGTAPINNYHGDTTVNDGTLLVFSAGAISPNSTYRLNTTQGKLHLEYVGDALVRGLYINGLEMSAGTYSSTTAPITGTGTITVPPPNVWNNASGDRLWNGTSANWTSPTTWLDGANALFGATGAGPVTNSAPVSAHKITFTAPGYVLEGNGNALTLVDSGAGITANAGTSNYLGVSIDGTSDVTFNGPGTTVLGGDASVPDANHYTGTSYFRSGTVVLAAQGADKGSIAGGPHAVESIGALDTGATVQFGTTFNGTSWVSAPGDQIGARIPGAKLIMTGGTLDYNNDFRNDSEVIPCPDGFGLIINNGSAAQCAVNVIMDGLDHTYSGLINDGNNGVLTGDNFGAGLTPQGPGYQIGIVSISGTAGSTWTLAGDNTYSGSTRIDGGTTVKLAGNHSLGIPTLTNSLTGPMRLVAGSAIDFNGRNQTIALMTDGSAGKMYNSAVGTVSTLTVGYGNENAANRSCSYQFLDNLGVGGKFAFRKIITQAYTYYQTNITTSEIITNVVTNCIQTLKAAAVATYSGDTSVDGGTLKVQGPSAISPNSAYRLSTANYANLWLDYSGDAPVRQLWINGVQQPNGTYGAGTPGIDPTSTGTITVTGFAPAALGVTQSGSNLNFSWSGVYQLESSTNNVLGPYSAYAGAGLNAATVPINPNVGAVYFRLATY